jgi:hypothetical protein
MALNPTRKYTRSFVDRSGEPTSYSVHVEDAIIDGGFVGTEIAAYETAEAALRDGVLTREGFSIGLKVSNVDHASAGQREQKFLISYEDTVTLAPYDFELPCRKVSLDPPINTDLYDITASPFAAYVTALEALAVSPDGNPINVTSIRLIGKNN